MALTFAVPDSVLSSTLANYRKKFEDNILKNIPLLYKLVEKGNKEVLSGGEKIAVALRYAKNTTFAGYSGYGVIDTTPAETNTSALYSLALIGL